MKRGITAVLLTVLVLAGSALCEGCGETSGEISGETSGETPGLISGETMENTESGEKLETASEQDNSSHIWEITQYGPRDMNSMFYTIYNEQEGLIVIDGGWTEDAEYVREVITSYGGEVEAWILTHPHQDHIGAFNAIYPEAGEISINHIYAVPMASPEDCLAVASWDSVAAYEDFLALDIQEVEYLSAGDELELCGLQVEVLSSFDENVRNLSRDYLNDGSLMFKVSGAKESFLFCADVGVGMSDFLLQKYGQEKLSSNYLQMAHHGFGGLKDDFYTAVNPMFAFFDAPDWLMLDTTGKYDTPEHAELMRNLGSEIFSFSSGPNTILLE